MKINRVNMHLEQCLPVRGAQVLTIIPGGEADRK